MGRSRTGIHLDHDGTEDISWITTALKTYSSLPSLPSGIIAGYVYIWVGGVGSFEAAVRSTCPSTTASRDPAAKPFTASGPHGAGAGVHSIWAGRGWHRRACCPGTVSRSLVKAV